MQTLKYSQWESSTFACWNRRKFLRPTLPSSSEHARASKRLSFPSRKNFCPKLLYDIAAAAMTHRSWRQLWRSFGGGLLWLRPRVRCLEWDILTLFTVIISYFDPVLEKQKLHNQWPATYGTDNIWTFYITFWSKLASWNCHSILFIVSSKIL